MKGNNYKPEKSPSKQAIHYQLDEHSQRIKELLRADMIMLQQQNAILKLKCKKVSELQEKVELVLRQNSQLLNENQKMGRILHQQKSEYQILKNKYESAYSQRHGAINDFEYERKKYLKQIEHLHEQLNQIENIKNGQINQMKSHFQMQIQGMKRQHASSENAYQIQIRKLRELLEKRQHQVRDLANKLTRVSSQSQYQILRLREEKQKLKNELIYSESDRIKQIEDLKHKLENNYLEQLDSIKHVHSNNVEQVESQCSKLKLMLSQKNNEFETLASKLNKQRSYYEDVVNHMKRQNESYRIKLAEQQKITSHEIVDTRQKLHMLHDAEIQDLSRKHQYQMRSLDEEIARLETNLRDKNNEIEGLIKEKVSARNLFDSEIIRLKDENLVVLQKLKQLQNKYNDTVNIYNNKLTDREKHIEYLESIIKSQKENNEAEQQSLQKIIETLKNQLSSERMNNREKEHQLREQINQIKYENTNLQDSLKHQQSQKQKKVDELRNQLNGTSNQLGSKVQAMITKNKLLQKQSQVLKNNIAIKEKQIKNLVERIKLSNQRQAKLENEIDDLRTKMIKKQQKANELMIDQKNRLDNAFSYTIQNMKTDHEAALKLEATRYKDLQQKLKKKELELQNLLKKYKQMTDEIQILTEQEANKKDITLKFPGATADLIATKNLFDVFLKTKVLDVCKDALKQNKQ